MDLAAVYAAAGAQAMLDHCAQWSAEPDPSDEDNPEVTERARARRYYFSKQV